MYLYSPILSHCISSCLSYSTICKCFCWFLNKSSSQKKPKKTKVASFHPHYSTFTPQTYHHPVHRFRSWPMQTTSQSHPHTQVRVQPRNTYNHTYTKFLPGQNKTTLTKSRQNNLHSVHTRLCKIYEQSGPNNKLQSTTHGNAPKGSGSYLRPKTHIQHTHPQHLSTSTQTSTNHKSTHCNRMG